MNITNLCFGEREARLRQKRSQNESAKWAHFVLALRATGAHTQSISYRMDEMPDAGTELRKALGQPEPDYGPNYRNPAYFGGYRSREDEADFAEHDRLCDLAERAESMAGHVEAGLRVIEPAVAA